MRFGLLLITATAVAFTPLPATAQDMPIINIAGPTAMNAVHRQARDNATKRKQIKKPQIVRKKAVRRAASRRR